MNQEAGTAETELADTGLLLSEPASLSLSSTVDSPPKKRTCEETSSPLSNKKTKEADAADGLPHYKHGSDADPITNHSNTDAADGLQSNEHENGASDKRAEWPLRNIKGEHFTDSQTTDNDLFLGHGHNNRLGNQKYVVLLESKKALYLASKRGTKSLVVADIIREWRAQDPPGRFLKMDLSKVNDTLKSYETNYGTWSDVGDEFVSMKISNALGKGARKQQRDSDESNGTVVSSSDEDQPSADEQLESAEASVHTNIENSENKCVTSSVALNDGNEGLVKQKKSQASHKSSTTAPQNKVSASKKENVRPHDHGSMYNDVLSFFASTPFDANSMLSLHVQKERGIMRESLIIPSRASLPIVPQKKFMNSKAPAPEVNSDQASPKSSPYVEKEVSKFLLEEAKHLVNAARPTPKNHTQPSLSDTYSSTAGLSTQQTPPHTSVAKFSHADSRKHPNGTAAPVSRPVSLRNEQHPIAEGYGARVIPYASPPAVMAAMAAYRTQVTNPQTASKIAMASKGITASAAKVQTAAAKMPLALGCHLNDNNASKHVAQAAEENSMAEGIKAAKSKGKTPRVSIDGKHKSSVSGTPKTPKTSCSTPKTPHTPALLLSTEAAPNLPTGWMSKTFQRTNGKTAGHKDTYFYSPQNEIKFRGMKGCKNFLQILTELGGDGNESNALKVYKERGNRF